MTDFTQYPRKDNVVYIYILIDPRDNRIRYIGKCVDPQKRFREHCLVQPKRNYRTYWLNLLNRLSIKPIIQIIEKCNDITWAEREIYWIAYGREKGWNLVNSTDGGEGLINYHHSEETKSKISAKMKGELNPMYGKNHTIETKKKQSDLKIGKLNKSKGIKRPNLAGENNPFYGKNHTEESKEKIKKSREPYKGENHSCAKLREEEVKEIKQLIRGGNRIVDIARKYNVAETTISSIKSGSNWKHVK